MEELADAAGIRLIDKQKEMKENTTEGQMYK